VSRATVRFVLIGLIAATVACDKVPLLAPTGSTVTLSISSTSVASNGTADVIAAVIESSGTPVHDGTEVTFQASVGQIDPVVVRTEGGIARSTFRANGASGTARVTAFSGGARATDIEVLVGGAAASTVNVRTSPTSVSQNGNPVEVIATVRDVSGNGLPGAQVVFSSDNGTLSANSAMTDSNGEARVTLTTNRQTIVRASIAGKEGQATVNLVTNPTVTVSASPTNPNVGIATVFTITPGPTTTGNAIANVTFDPGDGTPTVNLGPITSATTRSHIYTHADQYQATAVITDVAGLRGQGSAGVVVGRAIPTVNVSGPASVVVNEPATFTVTSAPGTGGPPLTLVRVAFSDVAGTRDVQPGTATISRTYSTTGTYEVTAVAFDQAGTQSPTARTSVVVRASATPVPPP